MLLRLCAAAAGGAPAATGSSQGAGASAAERARTAPGRTLKAAAAASAAGSAGAEAAASVGAELRRGPNFPEQQFSTSCTRQSAQQPGVCHRQWQAGLPLSGLAATWTCTICLVGREVYQVLETKAIVPHHTSPKAT